MAYVARLGQVNGTWRGDIRQRQDVLDQGALAELKAIVREMAARYGDSTLEAAIQATSPGAAQSVDSTIERACVLTEASNGFAVEITTTKIATRVTTTLHHVFAFSGSETATKRRTTLRDALAQIARSFGHSPLADAVAAITP